METIVDWLSHPGHHIWAVVGLGLWIVVVGGYFAWQDHHKRHYHISRSVNRYGQAKHWPHLKHWLPVFHFRFEGDACCGRNLVRDRKVRLVFAQGVATTLRKSVSFSGRKFLPLHDGDAQLAIVIWPGGGLSAIGPTVSIACFRGGLLLNEPVFDLFVTADCPDEVSITAEFFIGGTRLYGLTFSTCVVSTADSSKIETESLQHIVVDLDVANSVDVFSAATTRSACAGEGDLLLTLDLLPSGLLMSLVHTTAEAGMVPVGNAINTELDKSSVQTLLAQIRAELGETFYSSDVWSRSILAPLSTPEVEDVADCFGRVASAGSILNRALRSKNVDVARLFDYIEAQPPGTRLTIATSKVFLPFEILYPHHFTLDLPPDERGGRSVMHGDFWGTKFGLEVSFPNAGNYMALVRAHRRAPRKVSLNLNGTITGIGSPTPMEIHGKLERDLKARGVDCDSSSQCDQMKNILLGAGTEASVVYVYCHGSAADPFAGSLEELQLNDSRCIVRPTAIGGDQYTSAPIVFLNACYSGATSPMFFTGFLQSFRDKGALGLIATSFPVPVMFGAQFGADVVTECILGSGSIGERVRRLRRFHADEGNPVPLFYSVQCQLSN